MLALRWWAENYVFGIRSTCTVVVVSVKLVWVSSLGTCVQFLDVIAVYTPSVCWLELMLLYSYASFVV